MNSNRPFCRFLSRLYEITKYDHNSFRWLILFLLFIIPPASMIVGSYSDNTLFIDGPGVGLFEHYGIWGFIITNPLIGYFSILVWRKSIRIFQNIDILLSEEDSAISLYRLKSLQILFGRTKTFRLYFFMVFIGFLSTVANILQTIHPQTTYGNDVFDAYSYPVGFITTKIFLGITWIICYPLFLYIIFTSAVLIYILTKALLRSDYVTIDFFNPDECGGFGEFGEVNLLILLILSAIYFVIMALIETHSRIYLSVEIPLFIMSLLIIAQSIIGIYPIHKLIVQKKTETLDKINKALNEFVATPEIAINFPENLYTVRSHIKNINSFPYAANSVWIVNIIRFIPSAISIYKMAS